MVLLNTSQFEFGQLFAQVWPGLFFFISIILIGLFLFLIWKMGVIISTNRAIRKIAIEFQNAGIKTYRNSLPLLRKELDRQRRYGRPMAIIVLQFEGEPSKTAIQLFHSSEKNSNGSGHGNGNGNGNGKKKVLKSTDLTPMTIMIYGNIVHDLLRDCDIVTYDSIPNQFIIFLPETNRIQAQLFVERLNRLFSERVTTNFMATIVEFPTEGYTIEDLVNTAMAKVGEPIARNNTDGLTEIERFKRKKAS